MKYIIFDFDGTIGDSQSLIVKTLQDTMRARKLEVKSEEACAKTIGLRLDEAFVSLFGMSAEYEINKARRLGDTEIKKGRYRKLMEE